ncbi:hypothetical protein GCM10023203_05870 [Actinomycetospora straminea]|uniref:Uncharacterized protein n=2 Tax=Actinomycetospora straminea TaxID=663607 RepID=A0ABP9DZH2_9PSEU
MLPGMTTHGTTHPAHASDGSLLRALARRWPIAVGLLAAAASVLTGPNSAADPALIVVIAASCYVAAAAFARPWTAWAWVGVATVLVVAARLLDVSPVLVNVVTGTALVVLGVVRGVARHALRRQTAGFVGYGLVALVALALPAGPGLVLAALTLMAHGVWDLWHLRRHRDQVPPALAEACIALDVPAGLAMLVLAVLV